MPRRGPGLSETPTGEARKALDDYYRSLGAFVSAFARTEGVMLLTLRTFSGLTDAVGSALLSGVRADQSKDLINRVLDTKGHKAIKGSLQRHFQQFGLITKVRNDILHYGAEFETADVLLVSNDRDAHIPERLRETRITPLDLTRMNIDLHVIRCGLLAALDCVAPSLEREKWDAIAREPWQYKPPPPSPPANNTRPTPQARPRRPLS